MIFYILIYFYLLNILQLNANEEPSFSNELLTNDNKKPTGKSFSSWNELLDSSKWCEALLLVVVMSFYEKELSHLWYRLNDVKFVASLVSVLGKIVKASIGTVLLFILLIVLLPLFIILLIVKRIIINIIYFRFGNSVSELFGMDMLFATSFEDGNPIINTFVKFDGNLSIEEFETMFENKVENAALLPDGTKPFRKLKQTLQSYYGYFIWKDTDNFDIKNHVRRINLNELYPAEEQDKANMGLHNSCSETLVCKYLSEHGSKPLPENFPQWEIVILTEDSGRNDVMLLRLHHSIGDGLSLLRLLLEILADEPTKISFAVPPMNTFVKIFMYIWSLTLIPYGIFLMLQGIGRKNPLHGVPLSGEKIYLTSRDIPFDEVKYIRKATKALSTDILFTCLSSTLASFFKSRGTEVSDITMFFPIGAVDADAPVTLSNTFTMAIATLPTPSHYRLTENSPDKYLKYPNIERMRIIKRGFEIIKEDPTILSLRWIAILMAYVLPTFFCHILLKPFGKTISVSNVPGPCNDVIFIGKKIKEIRFWTPDSSPNGVGFTFISYKGQLRVSFNVDTALIDNREEAEMIIDDFIKSLKSLHKEVQEIYGSK